MSFRDLDLSHMVKLQPDDARVHIMAAYKEAGCSAREAAKLLCVAHRTFYRWTVALDMLDEIALEATKAKEDRRHHQAVGGRPQKTRGSYHLTNPEVRESPGVASAAIIAAYKEAKLSTRATAALFGVTRVTLNTWIRTLELHETLNALHPKKSEKAA